MTTDPSAAAPGRLEQVRRFVNTDDVYNGRDALTDAGSALTRLAEDGLAAGDGITEPELATLRDLRTALRDLAASNTTASAPSTAAVEAFNELVRPYPVPVRLGVEAGSVVALPPAPEGGAARVVATLASAVQDAVVTGRWQRLKSCSNPECTWLFYDTSRSRTGRWCSMGACGSIAKSRAYRARRRRTTG